MAEHPPYPPQRNGSFRSRLRRDVFSMTDPKRQASSVNCRGLTLIELIATVAIVSILSLSALPLAKISIKREKEMMLRRSLREMREAIDRYKDFSDRGF